MSLAAGLVNTLTVALAALPLATLLGVALGLARLSPEPVASRLAAVIIAPLRNTPVLLQLFVWYGLLLRLPDARQAWEPLPSVLLSNRGLALPALHGWLPQAASLIVAMLIAGWAIRRRRLATDGPAHRGHVLLIRVAPWLALAAQLLAWTLLPAPIVELPVRRGLACKAAGNPASNSPRWSSACRCSMPPISPTSCAPRCARCRRAGRGRTGAGAVAPGHPAPRGRAQCRARGAAALRHQCLALIKNSTLAIAIGYQDLMAVINTAITQTGLALEGISLALAAYLPGPGAGGALSAWNARSARHGPGDLHGARLGERPALLADPRGQGGGRWTRRLARTAVLLAALLAAGSLADWALLNAVRRGDAAACAQAAGACWAAVGENLPLLLFGAMQPAHRGPALVACAALLLAVAVEAGRGPAVRTGTRRRRHRRAGACRRRAVRLALGRRGHRPAALGRPAGHADPGDRGAAGRRAAGGRSGATAPLVQSRRLVRRRHADRGRARRAAGDATVVRVLRAAHAAGRRRVRSAWRWPR